jgi:hypothetical protein
VVAYEESDLELGEFQCFIVPAEAVGRPSTAPELAYKSLNYDVTL